MASRLSEFPWRPIGERHPWEHINFSFALGAARVHLPCIKFLQSIPLPATLKGSVSAAEQFAAHGPLFSLLARHLCCGAPFPTLLIGGPSVSLAIDLQAMVHVEKSHSQVRMDIPGFFRTSHHTL